MRFGYARFPRSDVDVSLIFSEHVDNVSVYVMKAKSALQAMLPLCREVNVYTQENITFVVRNANAYELKRDPEFSSNYASITKSFEESNVEKLMFILRMYITDYKRLQKHPRTRFKKWLSHLNFIECSSSQMSGDSFTKDSLEQILVKQFSPFNFPIREILDAVALYEEKVSNLALKDQYEFVAKNRYLYLVYFNKFCYVNYIKNWQLTEFDQFFLIAQYKWEIFGCAGQIYNYPKMIGVHLENLHQSLSFVTFSKCHEVARVISDDLSRIKLVIENKFTEVRVNES